MSTPLPLVSVLVASEDDSSDYSALLDSIEAQDYPSIEIVVSGPVRSAASVLDRRWIRPVRLLESKTVDVHGLEIDLAACGGDYLTLARTRDSWNVDRISLLVASLLALESDGGNTLPAIVFSDVLVVKGTQPHPFAFAATVSKTFGTWKLDDFLLSQHVPDASTLFNRALLERASPIPSAFDACEWWLLVTAATFGRLGCIEQALIRREPVTVHSLQDVRKVQDRTQGRFDAWCARAVAMVPTQTAISRVACRVGWIEARYAGQLPARAELVLTRFHASAASPWCALRFAGGARSGRGYLYSFLLSWLAARQMCGELAPPLRILDRRASAEASEQESAAASGAEPTKKRSWPERIGFRLDQAFAALAGRWRARRATARWILEPPALTGSRVCLLATYAADGRVAALTEGLCRSWSARGFVVVVVMACDRPHHVRLDGITGAAALLVRSNVGYDFGSWSAAIERIPDLDRCALLVMTNDSVFGPLDGFDRMLARVDSSTADVIGLTDSHEVRYHLQSYLLFYRPGALRSPSFWRFWRRARYHDREKTIRTGELLLLHAIRAGHLTVDVLFPTPSDFPGNPTLDRWRELIADDFPFVKVQLLRDNPTHANIERWDEVMAARACPAQQVMAHLGVGSRSPAAAAMSTAMGHDAPPLAIVTVNWNGWRMTLDCLEALRASSAGSPTWHAYVVDNASTDESLERLADLGSDTTLIRSPVNGGWTGGNNLGIERALAAGHQFIFLINNDASIHPDALTSLMATFEARSGEKPVLGCLQKTDDGNGLTYLAIGIDPATGLIVDLNPATKSEMLQHPLIPTPVVNGAALFAHRSTFESIGPFDERFFLNFDEADWCLTAAAAGHSLYTVRDAVVFHSGNKSIGGASSPLQQYFVFRNQLLFSEKHGTLLQRLRVARICITRIRDITGRKGLRDLLRQARAPSPILRATVAALRDYLLRRFGNCPDSIRLLND